ncbi:ABC transporter ATP-binding protein [Spiroplasma corruscae]|uniref:ABC transporter ATP-binding protein n=1 Tax=Spiroplasma corruscae TaxID=216934 RepID=A0A222ERI5_9MOLU|nr:ABC-F family ATP-binding cassette domain-containing protein [Spiroplasma corruscae]ASP28763.1 ABC transporter ATP-binding protein [Spiroplasma corruscae]
MGLVNIQNLSHANGDKKLYKEAVLKLNRREHIALVGPNGAGKTTLLNIISKKIIPDLGEVEIHPKTKIGYLDQHLSIKDDMEVNSYLKTAFQDLYDVEERMNIIYEKMSENYDENELVKALKYQDILNHNDFDSIEKKIGNLVNGLGIGIDKLDKKMSELSGGQKNKVMLAKLLLSDNDFLVLDEPTNFLDIEQVNWLASFLQSFEKAFIMVSHDQDFINKTCNIIYALDNLKLTRYVGNYDKYIEELAIQQEQYDKDFVSQQRKIKKLETYIAKNSARLSTAKSAQSRKKTLDKLDKMDKRKENIKPNFNFMYKEPASDVIIKAEDLVIGYDSPILHKLNFEIRKGEKCIIKGKNGIGKTTFLKTLSSELKPYSGDIKLGNGVVYSYFKQLEKVDDINAINYLMNRYNDLTEREARAKIGQFGLRNDLMIRPMSTLSGGEQTKVRLSALSMEPCSLLILDEPTNHIDSLAKESLLEAIMDFEGTVLLTTHDINFSTKWADKVINFEDLV